MYFKSPYLSFEFFNYEALQKKTTKRINDFLFDFKQLDKKIPRTLTISQPQLYSLTPNFSFLFPFS